MVPFQIKICGVTKIDEAIFAARSGASAIGLNFFQPSSRYVFPPGVPGSDPAKDDAAQIVAAIRGLSVSEKSPPVKIVGVFVNLEPERVVEIASSLGLDGIQLHGDEPASDAVEIRQKISSCQSRPAFLVRAIRTNPRTDPDSEKQTDAEAELSRIETEISRWLNQASMLYCLMLPRPLYSFASGRCIGKRLLSQWRSQRSQPRTPCS